MSREDIPSLRDDEYLRMNMSGKSCGAIASVVGLSAGRVTQLVARGRDRESHAVLEGQRYSSREAVFYETEIMYGKIVTVEHGAWHPYEASIPDV